MKRRLSKILVCALLVGAYSFVFIVNAFARSEVVNDTNDYIFLRVTQSDPAGNYSPMVWDYNSATSMSGVSFGITNSDQDFVPMYYPLYVVSYEGFNAEGVQSYLYHGEALTTKFMGDGVDFTFLEDKIYVSKISVMFTFGFEVGPSSALPSEPSFDSYALQFNGNVIPDTLYTKDNRRSVLTTNTDINTNSTFAFRNYRVTLTFNTPLEVTSTDGWDFSFNHTFTWDGFALEGYKFLTGISGMYVEYDYVDQYEAGVIGSNNAIIGGLKQEAVQIKDKLTSSVVLPCGEEVEDVLEIVNGGSVEGISNYLDILHSSLNADFRGVLLSMVLTSLAIAFCGYALHGKR